MKKISILLFVLLSVASTLKGENSDLSNSDKSTLEKLVHGWSNAHNSWDVAVFNNLYANDVLFYCNKFKKVTCISKKTSLFKPNDIFEQLIISNIELEKYPNKVVKASFTKKITTKRRTKEYPSYLLFYKINDLYKIVGEGDLITDKKLNFVLNIDDLVLPQSERINSLRVKKRNEVNEFLFYFGIISLFSAIVFILLRFIYKRQLKPTQNYIPEEAITYTVEEPENKKPELERLENILTSVEKGIMFENYIVDKFNPKYFIQHERRSDKRHNGVSPTASMKPDMEYEFRFGEQSVRFAVECKYFSNYFNGKIELSERQFNNYKQFEKSNSMTVYVAIGVGNTPNDPNDLYLIPLSELNSNIINIETLKNNSKPKTFRFFYKTEEKRLT